MLIFASRLLQGEKLIGTYMKTPAPIIAEVLALSPLDVVCLDAEHAPFDRTSLDACVHAFRSAAKPVLIRLEANEPTNIMQALDYGATGVIAAHISSAQAAHELVQGAHFGSGGRGYAGSTRAAGYNTKPLAQHLTDSEQETTVIAQIEDMEGVANIDEIAKVAGVDCLFIGRVDLTVDAGCTSFYAPEVIEAVTKVCDSGRVHNKIVGMFLPDIKELEQWSELGVSLFLMASDHGFIHKGAASLYKNFHAAKSK